MKNSTNPCDHGSLGALISCIDTECLVSTSSTSIALTPKAQFSCQQSLVPGSDEPSSSLTLNGNGECLTSPYRFRSFIASAGSSKHMNLVAQQCRMKLYEREDCAGAATDLDMKHLKDNACTFHGGKSARLHCGGGSDGAGNFPFF